MSDMAFAKGVDTPCFVHVIQSDSVSSWSKKISSLFPLSFSLPAWKNLRVLDLPHHAPTRHRLSLGQGYLREKSHNIACADAKGKSTKKSLGCSGPDLILTPHFLFTRLVSKKNSLFRSNPSLIYTCPCFTLF